MKAFSLILILILFGSHTAGAQPARSPTAADAISRMYAKFACEAVRVSACGPHREFVDQSPLDLARYFDAELVRLWFADRSCRHVVGAEDICWFEKLDFYPMWSSQEPAGTTFIVRSTASPTVVDVELHTREGDRVVLQYSLIATKAGWRIHDVSNGKLWSLLSVLTKGH